MGRMLRVVLLAVLAGAVGAARGRPALNDTVYAEVLKEVQGPCAAMDCARCTANPKCSWCGGAISASQSENATGLEKQIQDLAFHNLCVEGDADGPNKFNCVSKYWTEADQCPPSDPEVEDKGEADLKEAKALGSPAVMTIAGKACDSYTNCSHCSKNLACQWCDDGTGYCYSPLQSSSGYAEGAVKQMCFKKHNGECPPDTPEDSNTFTVYEKKDRNLGLYKNGTRCKKHTTCSACARDLACGWCSGQKKCVAGDISAPQNVSAKCDMYLFSQCATDKHGEMHCQKHKTCGNCTSNPFCGWGGGGVDECMDGMPEGPTFDQCNAWVSPGDGGQCSAPSKKAPTPPPPMAYAVISMARQISIPMFVPGYAAFQRWKENIEEATGADLNVQEMPEKKVATINLEQTTEVPLKVLETIAKEHHSVTARDFYTESIRVEDKLTPLYKDPCMQYSSCFQCVESPDNPNKCGWCPAAKMCFSTSLVKQPEYPCEVFNDKACPADPCLSLSNCAACAATPFCGWCEGKGDARCMSGDADGPSSDVCSRPAWFSSKSTCPNLASDLANPPEANIPTDPKMVLPGKEIFDEERPKALENFTTPCESVVVSQGNILNPADLRRCLHNPQCGWCAEVAGDKGKTPAGGKCMSGGLAGPSDEVSEPKLETAATTSTYNDFAGKCKAQGKRLCNFNEMCPNGAVRSTFKGQTPEAEMWVPVGNGLNTWAPISGDDQCKGTHELLKGRKPTWGTSIKAFKGRGTYACCDEIGERTCKMWVKESIVHYTAGQMWKMRKTWGKKNYRGRWGERWCRYGKGLCAPYKPGMKETAAERGALKHGPTPY